MSANVACYHEGVRSLDYYSTTKFPTINSLKRNSALVLSQTKMVSAVGVIACHPMMPPQQTSGIIDPTMDAACTLDDDDHSGYTPCTYDLHLTKPAFPVHPISVSMSPFDRETEINPSNRPRLQRRDANRPSPTSTSPSSPRSPRSPSSTRSRDTTTDLENFPLDPHESNDFMDPHEITLRHNFSVLHCFKRKPFLIYGESVLKGFIRRNESQLNGRRVVPGIVDIVASYYVDGEAGVFQFGHKLHRILKKAKRRGVSLKMVRALMEKYLSQKASATIKADVDIEFCCDELVRLGYLVPIPKRSRAGRSIMIPNNTANGEQDGESTLYRIPMDKVLEFSCGQH